MVVLPTSKSHLYSNVSRLPSYISFHERVACTTAKVCILLWIDLENFGIWKMIFHTCKKRVREREWSKWRTRDLYARSVCQEKSIHALNVFVFKYWQAVENLGIEFFYQKKKKRMKIPWMLLFGSLQKIFPLLSLIKY